jgi:hypothetical protein
MGVWGFFATPRRKNLQISKNWLKIQSLDEKTVLHSNHHRVGGLRD